MAWFCLEAKAGEVIHALNQDEAQEARADAAVDRSLRDRVPVLAARAGTRSGPAGPDPSANIELGLTTMEMGGGRE